jgi:Ca-activated chloride channel homolog
LQVGLGKTNTSFQPQAFGLVTLTPPEANRGTKAVPRELIVLLDTSGSMAGAPLRQAKHITQALIESLNDEDQLELVEFSWRASHWRPSAQPATPANKAAALHWLASLEAGGGTEMHDGIREAMQCLQPTSQRQIVLISDGLIGFEKEVIGEIANNLPSNARFFTVGVGSAVNRSLTGPAARAGRGSEFIAGLNDDAQLLAQRIVVRTKAPVLVDLKVAGSALLQCAPEKLPDLYVGCPLQLALRLKPEGGIIELRGRKNNAPWRRTVKIEALAERSQKPHLERLFARECVEDLEMRRAMGASTAAAIEEMGLRHQIATSQTSWIALSEQATVDPTSPSRHQRIGQALPQGMNAAALGLRSAAPALLQPMAWSAMPPAAPAPAAGPAPAAAKHLAPSPPSPLPPGDRQRFTTGAPPPPAMSTPAMAPPSFGSAADAEPEAESPEEEAFVPQRARRSMPLSPTSEPTILQGRLLLLDEEMLVIEVELMQAMRWQPGAIHALLADGQRIELELDPSQTTRFGLHGAGLRLRLSLRNHQGQRPSCIDLRIAGQLHRIVIN